MSRETAEEFLRLQEAATEGPWEICDSETWSIEGPLTEVCEVGEENGYKVAEDAELICHARNTTLATEHLALWDEVERLKRGIMKLAIHNSLGAYVDYQGKEWCLFDARGEGVMAGQTYLELIERLGDET